MVSNNLLQKLHKRGFIAQITNKKELADRLNSGPIVFYCGFDPTSDSLHLGHLVPLFCLKHFQLAGHRPIALVGGATGLIGDPSYKTTERKLNTVESIREWVEKIKYQVSSILDFNCGNNSAIVVNNYDWFRSISVLTFLRYIGKYFSVNQMIKKETVKQRFKRANNGISFTEFSYNVLQGYDFAYLNKKYGVALQIGGSDQWGNITSGIDLTRRLNNHTVYGLTLPIINKKNGNKFGKTESDTIWIDPNKTSPYKFYQFWINTADSDVYRFLKIFTFLELATIEAIEQADLDRGSKAPSAQYILAEEITRIIHGKHGLATAKRITASIFTGTIANLTKADLDQMAQDGIPTVVIERNIDLQQALLTSDIAISRRQARILIKSHAISINGKKQTSEDYVFNEYDKLYGSYTLLRKGKKHNFLLHWKIT
ncbi:Tyrosine--tRNA ligase [secondary endosymbiont of Trabutina mannipara]|uniref:Tyrosine--tRNA ligase n=1 Tax=secondary endosymbiont of Trabutina mannipara TaxID=1835721 RepID=A0A1C3L450_9ENTR|nr:tyrosine--tRNA ligase [secondary endosymbiont of Trabutina mannipara]SBT82052.1 Tyrosine--tRNA ligase [secondary endosymbiont of Trabutina mannipara]